MWTSLALLATLLAAAPADLEFTGLVSTKGKAVAVLHSGGRTRIVGVGERAFGGLVIAVERHRVRLDFDGRSLDLELVEGRPRAEAEKAPRPDPGTAKPPLRPERPASPETAPARTFSREEVQRRLAEEIPRILAETTVTPAYEEGRVVGLTMSRLPPGSLLMDAGLQAGDVITRINGTDIDGLGTLMGLWPRLQSASELRATVLRGGVPVELGLDVR